MKQPEDKLKRTKAKLKAAEERKDELETKSLRHGPRSLDSGELAELEKLKDETIPQLEKEIEDWDAENRQEETRLSGDSRPFLK